MMQLTGTVFDDILEFLVTTPTAQELVAYRPPQAQQARFSELLELNRTDQLTADDKRELDEYMRLEHYLTILRAKNRLALIRQPVPIYQAIYVNSSTHARGCCEYCHISDEDTGFSHEVDHTRATKHRGETVEDNLCLSCVICNRNKGSDVASFDPYDDKLTPLFNPRTHQWEEHFQHDGEYIDGMSPEGRATSELFDMNSVEQVERRRILGLLNTYPCQ